MKGKKIFKTVGNAAKITAAIGVVAVIGNGAARSTGQLFDVAERLIKKPEPPEQPDVIEIRRKGIFRRKAEYNVTRNEWVKKEKEVK